jgi:hypothetical protein
MPSMPSMIRARWTQLFRGKPQLHTAFSLDTVLTELAYIVGPPLAIGLSVSFFAEAGPLVAVGLLAVGVTAFLLQRQTEPKVVVGNKSHTGSTLLIPGVRTIVLALLAMGAIGGSIDVAVVAFANAQGWPASATFILAAYALGSLIAGLTFGALRVSLLIEKQFLIGILFPVSDAVYRRHIVCANDGRGHEAGDNHHPSVEDHRRADMDDHRHQHRRSAWRHACGAGH